MGIENNYAPVTTIGDGATVDFSYNWDVLIADYIIVNLQLISTGVLTLQVLDSDFTLEFDATGGVVTFGAAPSNLNNIIISRLTEKNQSDKYSTAQGFQGVSHENSYDKLTAITQDICDVLTRIPQFEFGSGNENITIDDPDADKFLVWNGAGDGITNSVFGDSDIPETTDDLTEGTTNLYDKNVVLNEGFGIEITGTYPTFTIAGTGVVENTDKRVQVSSNDGSTGFLDTKISSDDSTVTLAITDPAGNEALDLSVDHENILNIGTNTHPQIDSHIANTSNPHNTTATLVPNTPAGSISSTDVQGALNELDSEKMGGSTGATDNSVLRADGTGGATLQDSLVTIDDVGNITTPEDIIADGVRLKNYATIQSTTGLITGGLGSVNTDTTKFDISDGSGVVIDAFTDYLNAVIVELTWTGLTGITPTYNANGISYIYIFNVAGVATVGQSLTELTAEQHRDFISVFRVFSADLVNVSTITDLPAVVLGKGYLVDDLARGIGNINLIGNSFVNSGSNLELKKDAGTSFQSGINYVNEKNPNNLTSAEIDPVTWFYIYSDGAGGATIVGSQTDVDPDLYDDGSGVLSSMPSNKFQNQRIWFIPSSGNVGIQYGQTIYNSMSEALEGLDTEDFIRLIPELVDSVLRTTLSLKKGTTDLSDTDDALFRQTGKFGFAGGGGAGSGAGNQDLQSVYNLSTTPEILTDSTRGALSLKRGSSTDTDNVLEIVNGAGSITSFIQGDGDATFGVTTLADASLLATSAAPTTDAMIANKKYVDDNAGGSPLTTKGDVSGFSTVNARIPVGSNGQVLTSDSTQALGLKWAAGGGTASLPIGYINGGLISNDAVTPDSLIDITAIECRSDDNTVDISISALTNFDITTNANWASGTAPTLTSIIVYLWADDDSGVPRYIYDDATGTNLTDSGKARRAGAFLTDSSGDIIPFISTDIHGGIKYTYLSFIGESSTLPTTTKTDVPVSVPPNMTGEFSIKSNSFSTTGTVRYIKIAETGSDYTTINVNNSDMLAFGNANFVKSDSPNKEIIVDSSSEISVKTDVTITTGTFNISTLAYTDWRN